MDKQEQWVTSSEETLACLARMERLLETIAKNVEEHLETIRRLLASRTLKADAAQADLSRVTGAADQSGVQAWAIREVTIDSVKHMVTFRDQPIELTRTEFDLLFSLVRNAGRVLGCQELVGEVWGYELDERNARYLVGPHITHLQQKLVAEPQSPGYIQNVRGVGYFFERRTRHRQ
ncbi:MAG: response regulator transcription factor [Anaerolineales bacterium]|nr:response regulator transcription factor [Anaerolineales bacterium]